MQDIKATNAEIEKTAKLNLTENIFESSPPIAIFQKDKQPIIVAPKDEDSKKAVDMKFAFDDIGGEVAGPGYYWANIDSLIKFLDVHEKYKNPYFYENLLLVKKVVKRKFTRKAK
jgi:hypothetical protein